VNDFLFLLLTIILFSLAFTSEILLAEMCGVIDFKEVGQFEAKFYVEGLRFAPISKDR